MRWEEANQGVGGIEAGCSDLPLLPTGRSYDEKVDIFSFGILLCEVSALPRAQCYMSVHTSPLPSALPFCQGFKNPASLGDAPAWEPSS